MSARTIALEVQNSPKGIIFHKTTTWTNALHREIIEAKSDSFIVLLGIDGKTECFVQSGEFEKCIQTASSSSLYNKQ